MEEVCSSQLTSSVPPVEEAVYPCPRCPAAEVEVGVEELLVALFWLPCTSKTTVPLCTGVALPPALVGAGYPMMPVGGGGAGRLGTGTVPSCACGFPVGLGSVRASLLLGSVVTVVVLVPWCKGCLYVL